MINLRNKLKPIDSNEFIESRVPVAVWITLVYGTALFLQNLTQPLLVASIFFTIIMALYLALYFVASTLFVKVPWIYFGIQGLLIVISAFIMPTGSPAIFFGLIPIMISQSIGIYYHSIKVICTFFFFYIIFFIDIYIANRSKDLVTFVPLFLFIIIFVSAYSLLFSKQVKARIRTQKVLRELEFAYEEVEELTLANERQRMARDLHDTLAQGLAGIIMQLEAVNTHLSNENTKRAQEIVQNSMKQARRTLSDARLVIDDLRFQSDSDIDFVNQIKNEINHFKAIVNISTTLDIRVESNLPTKLVEHSLYIVRECLTNITKHSKAKNVSVKIIEDTNQMCMNILDDGIGFNAKLLNKLYGHYGLLGITERIRVIGGSIEIQSTKKTGTSINVKLPIKKGY